MSQRFDHGSSSEDSEEETFLNGQTVQVGLQLSAPLSRSSENIAAAVNERRISLNLAHHRKRKQVNFGICFDIDGVLARGSEVIPAAKSGFEKLVDAEGKFKYPVAFVTNALNTSQDKANSISSWFGIPISKDQVIQSPSPLEVFEEYHNKFCLVVGQGKVKEIAQNLGFKKLCTIDDVAAARPLLDVIDHDNRKKIDPDFVNKEFPLVEVVLLFGEPKHWESVVQIVVDVLTTNGNPDNQPATRQEKHLPVIACNMDLTFMERCHMPRFGHGAFLVCLEALYKKVSGNSLHYTSLLGKPSEITYRFAEHVLAREALKLGFKQPLRTMYLIGYVPLNMS